jgi:DNA helicase-2/ATP-dependent DNA helicase PcrA
MHAAYLEKLNPQQRRAVEHGVQENACIPAAPLLVIAGAGSSKTKSLAHRVAHLIVKGADPRRILLMTFSRRAAADMTRQAPRANAGIMAGALSWPAPFTASAQRSCATMPNRPNANVTPRQIRARVVLPLPALFEASS